MQNNENSRRKIRLKSRNQLPERLYSSGGSADHNDVRCLHGPIVSFPFQITNSNLVLPGLSQETLRFVARSARPMHLHSRAETLYGEPLVIYPPEFLWLATVWLGEEFQNADWPADDPASPFTAATNCVSCGKRIRASIAPLKVVDLTPPGRLSWGCQARPDWQAMRGIPATPGSTLPPELHRALLPGRR